MVTQQQITNFGAYLSENEKSTQTTRKYIHDVKKFAAWIGEREAVKSEIIAYKALLAEKYAPASVNAALSSLNSFFHFIGRYDLRVRTLKIQRNIFASSEREMTKSEYEQLLAAAHRKRDERLHLLMQTICSTGIRVRKPPRAVCHRRFSYKIRLSFTASKKRPEEP